VIDLFRPVILERKGKRVEPLGAWPSPPSPAKSEAQRQRAIAAAAKRRERKA
jgi:hypothetical protein